jgi:hypothetical protein
MFMPMSSKMSSTSALSSASVRNVMVVVIDCTPIVNTFARRIIRCMTKCNIDCVFYGRVQPLDEL